MSGQHLVLLNPPAEVVSALASVTKACRSWVPTLVPDLPLPPPSAELGSGLTPADLCHFVADPSAGYWLTFYIGVGASLLALFMVWFFGLHRVSFFIWRSAMRATGRLRVRLVR